MKKLVFGLIATVMFSFVGHAQTSKVDIEKMFGPIENLQVPNEILAKSAGETKDQILPFYIESQKGWFVVVGNEDGVVALYLTKGIKLTDEDLNTFITEKRTSHSKCEDKPSDMGVILCMAATIFDSVAHLLGAR